MQGVGGVLGVAACTEEESRQTWDWQEYQPYWTVQPDNSSD